MQKRLTSVLTAMACLILWNPFAMGGAYEDGVLAYTVQDYPTAITNFKKDLKANPGHTEAMYHLGMAYFKSKQYEDARESFQMVARVASPYDEMAKDSKRYLEKIDMKLMSNAGLQPTTQKSGTGMMLSYSVESLKDGSNYYGYINETGPANVFDLSRPVTVHVQSGQNVSGWSAEKEKFALQSAFAAWRAALNNKVTFQITANAEAADIVVRWKKTDPEVAGLCQGYGWGGKQLQAYVNLYTFHPDNVTPYSTADLGFAATHEFGHALGISGHSPYEDDVMYYTFSPKQTGHLTGRDIKTMQMVYSEKAMY